MATSIYKSVTFDRGFSLLEVLIALVILATALIALSGSISRSLKDHVHFKEQTYAQYVANYQLGELRLKSEWPSDGTTRGEITMLKTEWLWKQTIEKTTEPNLKRVDISVSQRKDENYSLATISAFIGKKGSKDDRGPR